LIVLPFASCKARLTSPLDSWLSLAGAFVPPLCSPQPTIAVMPQTVPEQTGSPSSGPELARGRPRIASGNSREFSGFIGHFAEQHCRLCRAISKTGIRSPNSGERARFRQLAPREPRVTVQCRIGSAFAGAASIAESKRGASLRAG
jgi:hypothetical protein